MQIVQCVARYTLISAAAFILAACAGQKEPAAKPVEDAAHDKEHDKQLVASAT